MESEDDDFVGMVAEVVLELRRVVVRRKPFNCGGGMGNAGGEEHYKFYWAELVQTVVYIKNRIGNNMSVQEPNLRHLRIFRSIAYVHVPVS